MTHATFRSDNRTRFLSRLTVCAMLLLLSADCILAQTTLIRFNTVGYLPSRPKRASIAAACTSFTVVRVSDSSVAYSGSVTGPVMNSDTSEQLYTADFSALTEEGDFRLDVPGVGVSATFRIAGNVYDQAFYTITRGMYLWRCGTAVSGVHNGATFSHAACHMNDAWMDYVGGGHVKKTGTKGWHDAGDYNKYVVNAGVTVGAMFRAWDDFAPRIQTLSLNIPESGGGIPDFLAELKWETDWLLTMQAPDGSVYHKLSTLNFGGFILPENENGVSRYFTPWGSAATADFVAMMSQASRYFRPYDPAYADVCLNAASNSYAFLVANPANHAADQSGFSTGTYGTTDSDDRLWAAAELWETTGASNVLADLETRVRSSATFNADFDWGNVKNLGMFTYALSQRPSRDLSLLNIVRGNLATTANGIIATRNGHGYNRPLGTSYYWGCNGSVARQALVLLSAYRVSPKPEYLDVALDALAHLLGRNMYGRSLVTGLGYLPPLHPHDRRSGGDIVAAPWPGYVVGGGWPTAADWEDVEANYEVNEIAINWNAALNYLVAAFTAPGSVAVSNGWYRLSPALNDSAAMNSPSVPPTNGTPAQEFTWNNNAAQRWLIQSLGGGYFRVSLQADTNSALEIQDGAASSGAPVVISAWNGSFQQQWAITNNGDGSFRLTPRVNAGAALDVANGSTNNGTAFLDNSWNGSLGQRWYLVGINPPTPPPIPWETGDIGTVTATGDANYFNGSFTASGSGTGLGGTADECLYVYQLIGGDCDIRARIASVQNVPSSARGGVMIRETLNPDSTFTSVALGAANGTAFIRRTTTGGSATTTTSTSNIWVRVTRSGSTLTGYRSSNGTSWTSLGTATIAMSNIFYVGLPVSSYSDGTLSTVSFDNVSLFVTNANTAPALTALGDQTVEAGQTVALTATATDTNVPAQTLTFSLLNAPANATFDVINNVCTLNWRPLMTQADSTNLVSIKVADNGLPGMSATQSCFITVNPLTIPSVSASSSGGQITLSFGGAAGPDYAVQTSSNLVQWDTVFTTNSPAVPFLWTDTAGTTDPARFYRVVIGPPFP